MNISLTTLTERIPQTHKEPVLFSVWDPKGSAPGQYILITPTLLKKAESISTNGEIDADELLKLAISETNGTAEATFTARALNNLNSLYYGSCVDAFTKKSDLATFFVNRRQVNYAFLQLWLSSTTSEVVRIKEMCCGSVYKRWQYISQYLPKRKSLDVTLSDFSLDIIPQDTITALNLKNINFNFEQHNLNDPFPVIPEDQRYNVFFTTYGFDSVWMKDDATYYVNKDEWYQVKYRVKVIPESHHFDMLLDAVQTGYREEGVHLHDFRDIVVENIAEKIDIKSVPYGQMIFDTYNDYDDVLINFPGGLLFAVEQAFESQIRKDGMFVIGDVMNYKGDVDEIDYNISYFNTTGMVGKYKVDDYYIAEKILKSKGYSVEVIDVRKFVEKYGKQFEEESEDTYVMVVKKA